MTAYSPDLHTSKQSLVKVPSEAEGKSTKTLIIPPTGWYLIRNEKADSDASGVGIGWGSVGLSAVRLYAIRNPAAARDGLSIR